MAGHALTLEEELEQQGVTGIYIWKPNRLFAKRGDRYESADVVSDGSASEVASVVAAEGQAKVSELNALAAAQKALIAENESDYVAVRTSLLQTYRRMRNYFFYQDLTEMQELMEEAISRIEEELSDV